MATTTNYSWTTPDDTALVKDGAAAIRSLGTSIDTTTKNLNPSTTLGDIEYRSSTANTNTRLAIGSTGNVLTVAAGVPTWAAPSVAGLNLIDEVQFTNSNAINVNNVFSSTYNNYRIILVSKIGTLSSTSLRFRVSGTDESANYQGIRMYAESGSVGTDNNVVGTDEIFLGTSATAADAQSIQVYDIASPFLAKQTNLSGIHGLTGTYLINVNYGVQTDSTSFTGFSIINGTSGLTGTVSVYGYAKE